MLLLLSSAELSPPSLSTSSCGTQHIGPCERKEAKNNMPKGTAFFEVTAREPREAKLSQATSENIIIPIH